MTLRTCVYFQGGVKFGCFGLEVFDGRVWGHVLYGGGLCTVVSVAVV